MHTLTARHFHFSCFIAIWILESQRKKRTAKAASIGLQIPSKKVVWGVFRWSSIFLEGIWSPRACGTLKATCLEECLVVQKFMFSKRLKESLQFGTSMGQNPTTCYPKPLRNDDQTLPQKATPLCSQSHPQRLPGGHVCRQRTPSCS